MSVLEYRRSIVQGLLTKQTLGKKRPSTQIDKNVKRRKNQFSLPQDVRTGNRGIHRPTFVKERRRCEVCSPKQIESRPYSKCMHCNIRLCINEKKNCFNEYHEI
ncbi:unnamed protein product [Macrosiphum euphorbiae]|uniref:PiggyBac transposable element-derived protein 4 C-terminal zinc-ribbon domain-containing protein n=1 Tax=Macrosiphum euphorbiae TaxID=13131 RepID=A0AAV0WIR4_9HEMI|nr:unnamed protein product [Macrosiphum euphorbiae]